MQTFNPQPWPRFATRFPVLTLALTLAAAAPAQAAAPRAVQWSAAQIHAAQLQIEPLVPAAYRQRFDARATVQNPAALLQSQSALDIAQARLLAARAALQLAQLQAQRAQALFQAGQNVALAQVQQALAAAQQAQAEVGVAQAALRAVRAERDASLGPALATRLQHDAVLRAALADGRELIVDLTLPPGAILPAGAQVRLRLPGDETARHDGWLPASVVGPAASASALEQGLRYALVAPAADGLMPGLQLQARAQAGLARSGVLLPASSVVWAEGQAVAFIATPVAPAAAITVTPPAHATAATAAGGAYRFTPRAVSTAWPLAGGYVQPGWMALNVVTHGAGLVLTPPPKPHALPAGGGDDD